MRRFAVAVALVERSFRRQKIVSVGRSPVTVRIGSDNHLVRRLCSAGRSRSTRRRESIQSREGLSLVSVAKLVDFELGQVSYIDFIGITVLPCG